MRNAAIAGVLLIALAGAWFALRPAAPPSATNAAATGLPARVEAKNCRAVTAPFIGTVCTPQPDTGKHPAVLLLGGSEGGDGMSRVAPYVAAHGYVAVSVAYFGLPGLPPELVNVPVEPIGRALGAIARRSDVDASRIAILGGSKGGELALLAASTYPQIKAVVAVVPSPVAFMGLDRNNYPHGCSWTVGGKTLPCVPADPNAERAIGTAFASGRGVDLRALYDASLAANPAAVAAAYFPLQRIAGPVLCLAGSDDRLWDSPKYCDMAMRYLHAHGHPYADKAIDFPNAGHTFLWAMKGPSSAITSFDTGGARIDLGGTKAADVAASRQGWAVIWGFLANGLGRS